MKPTVTVKCTNGFGNNLFQYIYARLIAENNDCDLYMDFQKKAEYAIETFEELGIKLTTGKPFRIRPIKVTDKNASVEFYKPTFRGKSFKLSGYFGAYRLYHNHFDQIKTWFPPREATNKKDLVFHLRMGDRLFLKNTYMNGDQVRPEQYVSAIHKFDFDRLHIVTDMKNWAPLTQESLSKMKFHAGGAGGGEIIQSRRILNDNVAVEYFNGIFEALEKFNPIVRCGHKISDDFNFMRSFDNMLFQSGTLSWWAACLSNARKVGVYGPWRPFKGDRSGQLSEVNLPGWFMWE